MTTADTTATTLSGPGGTFVTLSGDVLRAGSPDFERRWRVLADGSLVAESFRDNAVGMEWVAESGETPAAAEPVSATLEAGSAGSAVESPSLVVVLRVGGAAQSVSYRLQLFLGVRGVRIVRQTGGAAPAGLTASDADGGAAPTGIEVDEAAAKTPPDEATPGTVDGFALAPLHLRLVQVSLQDQTDRYNELAWEREWLLHTAEKAMALSGCLFFAEDVLTGTGLIFLKEAPLPYARPRPTDADLEVAPAPRKFTLLGEPGDGDEYPVAVLAYAGGKFGRAAALQAYQRARRPYVPGRDGLLLSNTWGDRNRDARVQADFLSQEIAAGARLGADVVQIDDGWQVGATSNSVRAQAQGGGVWEGYYGTRDDFWSVQRERFPEGLEPLVTAAREKGMRFGLWFSPDSSGDFANWRRDSDTLLNLHRTLSIDYFKMDGIKVRTRAGERNLHALIDAVLDGSGGKVVFDLDVTAETRPGYFGLAHAGPLFVENRYTDWHRYWPHQTLRNVWKLAHYVDPVRLRMEWLNHARNAEKYEGDPLGPAAYRPDYLFATVMFTSPLGWFEVSNLPEGYFAEAAPLIAAWKGHRDKVFGGTILPIGDAPDGVAWTGFVSVTEGGFYLLAFREANPEGEWRVTLPFAPKLEIPVEAARLGGDGTARLLPGQDLLVSIPQPRRFLFAFVPGIPG